MDRVRDEHTGSISTRKLLVALWRYLETGGIPKGAALKTVAV